MKPRRGQAARIIIESLHQLGRIAVLLVTLALALFGLFAYRLSQGPIEVPKLASYLATRLTGEGINVNVANAELAWAGYHKGGAVPLVLRLANINVTTASGGALVQIPAANLTLPVADLFGGRRPVLLNGMGATFPGGDVPVSWYANLWPGPGFTFLHGVVYVTVGTGRIGLGKNSVALSAAHFVLSVLQNGDIDVTNGMAQFSQHGQSLPHLAFGFHAHLERQWLGRLDVRLDTVHAQDLPAFWPSDLLPNTRKWVTRNITSGSAHDAHFTVEMTADGDLSHFRLENAQGQFRGDNLTLTWLHGAAPIEHLNGIFAMPDIHRAVVTASSGEIGGVSLKNGSLVIRDLTAKDQFGDLQLNLSGRVQDVLAILGAPPLNLLDTIPPEIRGATGAAQGDITATIPFKNNLNIADVALNVHANLTAVHMATPIPGVTFTNGKVDLVTDGHTLHAAATADFAGKPARITMDQNFLKNGNEILEIRGTAGPVLWHAFRLSTPSNVSLAATGYAPFEFSVNGPSNGQQKAVLTADLTQVGLALPLLGWTKSPGSTGNLAARFTLNNGSLVNIQNLNMEGPGFSLKGHSQGRLFMLDEAHIGRSKASGTLSAPASPGAPWVFRASGAVLDLRQESWTDSAGKKSSTSAPTTSTPVAPGPLWQASLAFKKLYISKPPAPGFVNFSLTASGQGYKLVQADGTAQGTSMTLKPHSAMLHSLTIKSDDAGMLLRALDIYGGMRGGRLSLQASYGSGPAHGVVKLFQGRLVDAPGFTKVLQEATLYGVAEAISGPGLLIDHATIPFLFDGSVLTLQGADAYSESLGFTASGTVNTSTNMCNLDTTIVPAYALNALPGKIPLLGHLFSAEKGGGLIAMRVHVQGPLYNPQISVNPLSALTPGFLRGIFGLGEAPPKGAGSTQKK